MHISALDGRPSLPVSADLENGYGPEPADAARRSPASAEAGAVGGSIEDYDARRSTTPQATERVAAAVEAARGARFPSRSPPAPRTTSAATPTSTTRSRACRPTRRAGADVALRTRPAHAAQIRAVGDGTRSR